MSSAVHQWYELIAMGIAFALAWIAWRTRVRIAVFLAAVACTVTSATVLLLGPIAFAFLFFLARRLRGWGLGWALVVAIPLTILGFRLHIPWPRPVPSGALRSATATVATVRDRSHIWGTGRSRGQKLRTPFQVAELHFTPPEAAAPITVRDTVDSGSVATLQPHGTVSIVYPPNDPTAARIAHANRDYAQDLFAYMIESTFGWAVVAVLVIAALAAARRTVRRVVAPPGSLLGRMAARQDEMRRIAALPNEDERRAALEALVGRPLPNDVWRSRRRR